MLCTLPLFPFHSCRRSACSYYSVSLRLAHIIPHKFGFLKLFLSTFGGLPLLCVCLRLAHPALHTFGFSYYSFHVRLFPLLCLRSACSHSVYLRLAPTLLSTFGLLTSSWTLSVNSYYHVRLIHSVLHTFGLFTPSVCSHHPGHVRLARTPYVLLAHTVLYMFGFFTQSSIPSIYWYCHCLLLLYPSTGIITVCAHYNPLLVFSRLLVQSSPTGIITAHSHYSGQVLPACTITACFILSYTRSFKHLHSANPHPDQLNFILTLTQLGPPRTTIFTLNLSFHNFTIHPRPDISWTTTNHLPHPDQLEPP